MRPENWADPEDTTRVVKAKKLLAIPEQVWINNYFNKRREKVEPYTELECVLLDLPYPSLKNKAADSRLQAHMQVLRLYRSDLLKAEEVEHICDVTFAIEWLENRLTREDLLRYFNGYCGYANNTRTHG